MKALTIWQPVTDARASAYLAGVLHGDGWCTPLTLGLRCKDFDFSAAFCAALNAGFALGKEPKRDERGYWLVRAGNKSGRFNDLRNYEPKSDEERAAWLRGFFDSEGNAQLLRQPRRGPRSVHRRVSVCGTNEETIAKVRTLFLDLDIEVAHYVQHIRLQSFGEKPLHVLYVRRRESFERFASLIGSNIARKRDRLNEIVSTYTDRSASARDAQLRGAAAKHAKLMTVTLPSVVAQVRELIKTGKKPTQRNCHQIKGYFSIQRYIAQADLVAMAEVKV